MTATETPKTTKTGAPFTTAWTSPGVNRGCGVTNVLGPIGGPAEL